MQKYTIIKCILECIRIMTVRHQNIIIIKRELNKRKEEIRMENVKKRIKENKGITLVALVVTIIVLLILARCIVNYGI